VYNDQLRKWNINEIERAKNIPVVKDSLLKPLLKDTVAEVLVNYERGC
jgi:hypothetical protein